MSILKEKDIVDIIWGATLYGGGGGGSMDDGIRMLEKFKREHPSNPVEVNLIPPSEMQDGKYAAVTAGMGAPTAIGGVDFSLYAVNAYESLKAMAEKMNPPMDLQYCMAVEMGGFNTFVPMLISLLTNVPFIDTDGAARAVPALDTLLLHVNGLNTSPLAMADGDNNKVTIEMSDPRNASLAEELGRHVCMAFKMLSGLSGWMVAKSDFMDGAKNRLPECSVSKAGKAGSIIRKHDVNAPDSVFDDLRKAGIECKTLCSGMTVTDVNTRQVGGFDYGIVSIGEEYKILFQNENLVVLKNDVPVMTVPDIICVLDKKTNKPLTNADVKVGMVVDVGLVKVDETWWKTGLDNVNQIWKTYFNNVEYKGEIIRFEDAKV